MRNVLGLMAALIAAPALAQTTTAPQMGERTTPPTAQSRVTDSRATDGPIVMAESACLNRLRQSIPVLKDSLSVADRREMRQLRDTAFIFARRGNENACQAIVVEIERMATAAPGTTADRRTQASSARGVAEGQTIRLETLLDSDIVALGGEYIGEVEDIVMVQGPQSRSYAIVDRDDSWFSIGGDLVAIPMDRLRSIGDEEFAVGMTAKAFDELPTIDRGKMSDAQAYAGVDRHWAAQAQ